MQPPCTTTYFLRFNFIRPDTPKNITPRDKQKIPLPSCDHPKSHPAPQNFTSHKELHYHPPPATSTIALRTHHQNHHAQQLIFCVSTSFILIHLKALLLATKQQIPPPSRDHPKSHPVPQSFTSHKELHYHPAPSATSTITLRTRHRNHHAQQFIFYVSTSFTLIHLKALLLATKQQIPLPSCDHPKSHPVPRNFTSHKELHYHPLPATSAIALHPPSQPPRTTTYFLRFNFIHPDTPKSVAPRDQATNPSTLLRPPKKPSCPTEFHFPQRASLPPVPRNFNHCPLPTIETTMPRT